MGEGEEDRAKKFHAGSIFATLSVSSESKMIIMYKHLAHQLLN